VNAAERVKRDERVLKLFLAGWNYQQIAESVGLKSRTSIHNIVTKGLKDSQERRGLLNDEAFAVHQERSEQLFQAHWINALKGDYKSAAICQRLLAQQSRLYGLGADSSMPAPEVIADGDFDEDELDELARLRATRFGA